MIGWRQCSLYLLLLVCCCINSMSAQTDLVLEQAKLETDAACCAIPNIDCDLVLSVGLPQPSPSAGANAGAGVGLDGSNSSKRRRRREANHVCPVEEEVKRQKEERTRTSYSWAEHSERQRVRSGQVHKERHRERRQALLSERYIEQLAINLLRFETCICQSLYPPSTCRIYFPPDFYTTSETGAGSVPGSVSGLGPSLFRPVLQQTDQLKRFACSYHSGGTVDCTLVSNSPYPESDNVTSEVDALIQSKIDKPQTDCLACVPLFCTFHVFKKRVNLPPASAANFSFNDDYRECLVNYTSRAEPPPETTPGPPRVPVIPTTPLPIRNTGRVPVVEKERSSYSNQDLLTYIFPNRNIVLELVSIFGNSSYLHGLAKGPPVRETENPYFAVADVNTSMQPSEPELEKHHGLGGTILGAVIGGALLGALLMALLIFILFRNRIFTRNVQLKRSLRGLAIIRMDTVSSQGQCDPSTDIPPPVARVTPMTAMAPRLSTSSSHVLPGPRRPSAASQVTTTPRLSISSGQVLPMPRTSISSGHVPPPPRRSSSSSHVIPAPRLSISSGHVKALPPPLSEARRADYLSREEDYTSVYTLVEGEEDNVTDLHYETDYIHQPRKPSFGDQKWPVLTFCQDQNLAHYEVPVVGKTRPQSDSPQGYSQVEDVTASLKSGMSSRWSDVTQWDTDELEGAWSEAEEGGGEHEYMEIRPEPA